MFTHLHIALTMAVITALFAVPGQQAPEPQEPAAIRIVNVDQSRFPEVKVSVSSTTSGGAPVRPAPAYTVSVADKPVTLTTEARRVPVAVAVVADLSQRMSDTGTTRFTQRFLDMKPLIGNLLSVLQALPDQYASLVTFKGDVQVMHPLTYNLGDVSNTVGQTGTQPFQPDPLPGAPAQQPYPLGQAVAAGLSQLESAPPEAQLVLAVFAAGDQAQRAAGAPLRQQIDALAAKGRSVQVLVVSFGSDQAQLPADPAGLSTLAQELGGTALLIGDKPLLPAQKQAINQRFAQILELGQLDVLGFDASGLPSGESVLRVAAKPAEATIKVNFGQLPPRAAVVIEPPSFQGPVRLSIAVQSQQADIRQVAYLLDNLPLAAAPQTGGPAFVLEVDTFSQEFQRRFPPGEHQLSAAVTDANGQETRVEPVAVTVVRPSERSLGQVLAGYWWALGLGLLAVVGGAGFAVKRKRSGSAAAPAPAARPTGPSPEQPAEPPTERVLPKDEPTDRVSAHSDDETERIGPTPTRRLFAWVVEITGNNGLRKIQRLPQDKRYIEIGRSRDTPPDIAFDDKQVSRNHARLQYDPNLDRLELVPEESVNGTFFGEEQRLLEAGARQQLREGDVFWVTKNYKLRLIRES